MRGLHASALYGLIAIVKTSMLSFVVGQLQKCKGKWREISESTGVPYNTLTKVAQGTITNPTIGTLQPLADYFRKHA